MKTKKHSKPRYRVHFETPEGIHQGTQYRRDSFSAHYLAQTGRRPGQNAVVSRRRYSVYLHERTYTDE